MPDIVPRIFAIIQSTFYRLFKGQQYFTVIQIAGQDRALHLLFILLDIND